MNNHKNEMNKETLFSGLAIVVVGIILSGISIIGGGLGSKLSNFSWRRPKEVKQDGEIIK